MHVADYNKKETSTGRRTISVQKNFENESCNTPLRLVNEWLSPALGTGSRDYALILRPTRTASEQELRNIYSLWRMFVYI
jgi:hypothetical protein